MMFQDVSNNIKLPSRKLTYPTWGKGKSSSNMPSQGDMLVPWRVAGHGGLFKSSLFSISLPEGGLRDGHIEGFIEFLNSWKWDECTGG